MIGTPPNVTEVEGGACSPHDQMRHVGVRKPWGTPRGVHGDGARVAPRGYFVTKDKCW